MRPLPYTQNISFICVSEDLGVSIVISLFVAGVWFSGGNFPIALCVCGIP